MSGAEKLDLDFKRLRKDFVSGKAKDERYSRENDAKFRAVHQKVATYEEFKEIVQASHLQPLSTKDRIQSRPTQQWNSACDGSTVATSCGVRGDTAAADEQPPAMAASASSPGQHGQAASGPAEVLPATSLLFHKQWRKNGAAERYRLLVAAGGRAVDVLHGEVSSDLLEGAVSVLSQHLRMPDDTPAAMHVLATLAASKRFSLNLEFFSSQSKTEANELFAAILSHAATMADSADPLMAESSANPAADHDHGDEQGMSGSSSVLGDAESWMECVTEKSVLLLASQYGIKSPCI